MNEQDEPELESRPQSRREWSGWLRSLVLPLALVVAIVGVLLYVQSNRDGGSDDGFGTVSLPDDRNATAEAPTARDGRAAPDFLLPQLDGESVRLSDLQGQPLVVNFWATWCTTCRAETPDLIAMYEAYRDAGLVLLGVNLRENEGAVSEFVEDFGISYPILFDRDGDVAGTWRIGGPNQGVPSTYFIDRDGVVRKIVFGTVTKKLADEGLALILPGGG
ncbi:MAG TPA: TlpA disulfide reductase family protein [Dehalococcoidia bacterium]|jgi:peroxiredoxin|nr:TlpA disulfide reductase family protein [Dehalococcoidia bacterium]